MQVPSAYYSQAMPKNAQQEPRNRQEGSSNGNNRNRIFKREDRTQAAGRRPEPEQAGRFIGVRPANPRAAQHICLNQQCTGAGTAPPRYGSHGRIGQLRDN